MAMGVVFRLLMGFHVQYSRILLNAAWRDEVIGQLRHCVQTGYIVCHVGLSHIPAERFL
jgi:hypothetical protein